MSTWNLTSVFAGSLPLHDFLWCCPVIWLCAIMRSVECSKVIKTNILSLTGPKSSDDHCVARIHSFKALSCMYLPYFIYNYDIFFVNNYFIVLCYSTEIRAVFSKKHPFSLNFELKIIEDFSFDTSCR